MTTLILCAMVSAVAGVLVGFLVGWRLGYLVLVDLIAASERRSEAVRELCDLVGRIGHCELCEGERQRIAAEIDRKHNNQRSEQ